MARVLNRITKQLIESANTPDYPPAEWIHDPDLSAVTGQPVKYWVITGDVITLADAAGQAQADADELAAINSDIHAILDSQPAQTRNIESTKIRALIELFNQRDNYLVNRISELQDTLIALQASSGNAGARLDALPVSYLATNTRPKSAAVQSYRNDINAGNQDS